jgi:hypothetical protein
MHCVYPSKDMAMDFHLRKGCTGTFFITSLLLLCPIRKPNNNAVERGLRESIVIRNIWWKLLRERSADARGDDERDGDVQAAGQELLSGWYGVHSASIIKRFPKLNRYLFNPIQSKNLILIFKTLIYGIRGCADS